MRNRNRNFGGEGSRASSGNPVTCVICEQVCLHVNFVSLANIVSGVIVLLCVFKCPLGGCLPTRLLISGLPALCLHRKPG